MKSLLLAAVLGLALPVAARAQPFSEPSGPDTYLLFQLGAFFPEGDYKSWDPGVSLGGRFGARFNPYLAAELEVSWDNTSQKIGTATQAFTDVPIAINLVGRLPGKVAELTLYGGAAVHLTGIETLAGNHVADTVFGMHVGAGLAFNLSRTMLVGVDGRWSWATANYGYGDIDIGGLRAVATLGYRF
jgi:opacity protein-like surface antigen